MAAWRFMAWPIMRMSKVAKYLGIDSIFGTRRITRPFWEYFRDKYLPRDESVPGLPWFEGPFVDAAAEAKRQFRFLLVYLHSEKHHNTPRFCKETLQRPAILHVLLDNFVLWGANVCEAEGYHYSHSLQACGFPFLGVIACIDGQKQLVMRLEGDLTEEVLISKLQDCVENVGPTLIAARAEVEARDTNERLRQQQEREYEEAQERDRQRMLQRQQQAEEERLARERSEAEARAEEERLQREEQLRQEREMQIEEERAVKLSMVAEEPAAGPNATTLRITLFDGSNIQRRFDLDTKMQEVHDFIKAQVNWTGQTFELTTNPVRLLDLDKTVRDEGLYPRAVVIAKEVEE